MNNKTTNTNGSKSQELLKQITSHIQQLAEATDVAKMSEAFQEYLAFCARFHHYSINNQWLILISKPDATYVAGYCKWKAMGRFVRKGEKGIPILAPVTRKLEDEEGLEKVQLAGFRLVYVFDVSQTEGEPLPDAPEWKSPEKNQDLQEKLISFAQIKGISVTIQKLQGEIQGVSKGGVIEIDIKAGTKTLIHEIAHELMHRGAERISLSSRVRELEAESVAYVVARHFSLNQLNSPNYVALHGADAGMILAHLDRVRETAVEIIHGIE